MPPPAPSAPNRPPPKIDSAPLDPSAWRPLLERLTSQGDATGPKSVEVIIAGLQEYQNARREARKQGIVLPEFSKNAENAFIRLSRGINNFVIFKEVGLYYMRDLEMPAVAVEHFERALVLGGQEKDIGPLIEVATVASQRQAKDAPMAAKMGVTEGHRRRPDLAEIMSTTGKISLKAQAAAAPQRPAPTPVYEEPVHEEERIPDRSPEEYLEMAKGFLRDKRLPQAAEVLRKVGNRGNRMELWQAWTTLGQAFFLAGHYAEAEEAYVMACAFRSDIMSSHFNMALAMQMNGKFMEAVNAYNQADLLEGNNPKVWCNLGAVYFQLSEYKRAELALRKTLQIKPDYGRAWDNLAASLGAMGMAKDAILACREAIKYRPESPETWFKFGALSFSEGMYEEAIDAFDRAKKDKVLGAQSYAYLSMSFASTNRAQKAEECIARITEADPACPLLWMAWNALGLCLYDAGNFEHSVSAYTSATHAQPNEPETWFNLGLAHKALQHAEEALQCYKQSLEINPKDAEAWHNIGAIFAEVDQYEEAVEAFGQEVAVDPNSLRGWYDLGLALERLGREADAGVAFNKASELQSKQQRPPGKP